jgi:uncharacterized SAM-binding protein YcdF (DUF218 family)
MSGSAPVTPRFRRLAFTAVAGFGFLCGLTLAWLVGLVWFAATVPITVEDPSTTTDAIVVLTGGSERLSTGLALLEANRGRKLFVSGVHKGVEMIELLRLTHQSLPEAPCCIILGHAADDTVGNAAETAAWMESEHFTSLRLVTAAYHMHRSLLEFHRAMPAVTIVPHPVFPDAFKKDEWWLWPGTAHLLASEYTKYLAARMRHWLLPMLPSPPLPAPSPPAPSSSPPSKEKS